MLFFVKIQATSVPLMDKSKTKGAVIINWYQGDGGIKGGGKNLSASTLRGGGQNLSASF